MSDLPPLELAQAYVVVGPNDQRGPYTLDLLINEVLAQRLSEATPVWWPGLTDWTTMGAHPGVVAEMQRRRGAAAPAPGWADPAAATQQGQYAQPGQQGQYAQPEQQYAQPEQQYAQPEQQYAQPDQYAQPEQQYAQPDQYAQQAPYAPSAPAEQGEDVVDAEIVETSTATTAGPDPEHLEIYTALVARSGARAQQLAAVTAVDEGLIEAVSTALAQAGFSEAERNDVDRGHELRFEGQGTDVVVVSLGRPEAGDLESLRRDHVPLTIAYRTGDAPSTIDEGSGEHGEVVVRPDEWTGQSTASVSLFLDLDHYVDDNGQLDDASVTRDVAATVAVVRSRLG